MDLKLHWAQMLELLRPGYGFFILLLMFILGLGAARVWSWVRLVGGF